MKLSEDQFDIIEAYLTNELSTTDRASFELDLQMDAELRAEVNRQRAMRMGLRALGIERAVERAKIQYKAELERDEQTPVQEPIVRPLINWRYWVAAASVVAVLGVGYYTYQQVTTQPADVAFAETLTSDPALELTKDFPAGKLSTATRTGFLDALKKYKAGNYDAVISQLKTLPADQQSIHYKNYFLGLSYLANKQPGEAIPLLSKAQASTSLSIRQKSEWFLALAYVKNGQKEKALPMLTKISTNKAHPFNSLAKQVLTKIQ
ncbi:hypothetical protein [Spirosoma fluviale]|uniref:Tetratricopeptide repeat-containing protein n=1 Tax=Spirosoma fluviale TaxID=1597977 RepID=A0A286F8H1_9BACT|nr:hypothetical protein [Spirosoma fluviale]SOD79492.1 hypothetical protein SAMN06269250_0977 [Spirosoma fluviale]